ncbi:MAG: hypothetical protein Q4F71_10615, partial [Paracoccus sp. (in: a-proteobacteria)]|nr:hypothetical protein [Paracoccus sp. (in: a-proteobacteria)]
MMSSGQLSGGFAPAISGITPQRAIAGEVPPARAAMPCAEPRIAALIFPESAYISPRITKPGTRPPSAPLKEAHMAKAKFERTKPHVNIGT